MEIEPRRRAQIIRAIEDHAARYAYPHSPAGLTDPVRYVAEGHVPNCTTEEYRWIAAYLCEHPNVTQRAPLTQRELVARDRRNRGHARALTDHARKLCIANEFTAALYVIDRAEFLDPDDFGRWDKLRLVIAKFAEMESIH